MQMIFAVFLFGSILLLILVWTFYEKNVDLALQLNKVEILDEMKNFFTMYNLFFVLIGFISMITIIGDPYGLTLLPELLSSFIFGSTLLVLRYMLEKKECLHQP